VQLGLGITSSAVEHCGNFGAIESVNIMEEKDAPIALRHVGQSSIEVETVSHAGLHQVASTEAAADTFVRDVFHQVVEGDDRQCAFAQVHQNGVNGESMQPRGKGRVTAKHGNPPVDLEKCFLGKVFGEGKVSDHAHADRENAPLVLQVKI
jgi:hypothetical protein